MNTKHLQIINSLFINLWTWTEKNDQKNITKSLALSIHVYIYYPWYQSFSTWGMYSMMYIIGIRCTIVHYNLTPDWFCVKIFDLMQKMYFEMDLHVKLEFWSSYSTSSLCNWLFREQNMSAVAKQTKNSSRMLSEMQIKNYRVKCQRQSRHKSDEWKILIMTVIAIWHFLRFVWKV